MIEGINSSVATASLLRPAVEQEVNARAQSASLEPVQELVQAPYVSPYIFVNNTYNKAVLQIRDGDSGDVVRQIPSDTQLRAYSQAARQPIVTQKEPEPIEPVAKAPVQSSAPATPAVSSTAPAPTSEAPTEPAGGTDDAGADSSVLITA